MPQAHQLVTSKFKYYISCILSTISTSKNKDKNTWPISNDIMYITIDDTTFKVSLFCL